MNAFEKFIFFDAMQIGKSFFTMSFFPVDELYINCKFM